ncbi:lycopene cyclase [Glycocaulis alkaliphilus]|nr:lycopene cyclase [Glycocaulis alkaliphilus]
MRVRPDVDVIIIGAGLAGLMLAERLAVSGRRRMRAEVLEQAAAINLSGRSWSWYEAGKPRTAFAASWPAWQVGGGNLTAGRRFADGRYGLMRSETVVQRAVDTIQASQDVELRTGVTVNAMYRASGFVRLETSDGTLTALRVIDTRPAGAELMDAARWVRTGVRAEVRAGSACFAPDTAILVHRLRQEGRALAFETILPLAPDQAVVEAVRIAPSGDERRPEFDGALERITGGGAADTGVRTRSASPLGLSDHWPLMAGPAHLAASRGAGLALVGAPGRDAHRALAWVEPAFGALVDGRQPPGLHVQPVLAWLAGRAVINRLMSRPARLVTMAERTAGDGLVRSLGGAGTVRGALNLLWASR